MPDKHRVLYVDDEPDLLEIGKLFLEESGCFSVDIIPSATTALTLLDATKYDVIISDYQMPGMDGIGFLKSVRASGNTIPFILFTGRGREEIVIEALNEGANFYLQKGGEPEAQFAELIHKIQIAVEHQRTTENIQALNRLYSVLSATNKAIFRIQTKDEFFFEICRILVETGGFRMAWIGLADPGQKLIRPVASAGHVDGYLDSIIISTEDIPHGRGPTGTAYREGKYFWSNDITQDPRMEPWRENALKHGYLANAAFAFALGTKNAGVLSVYAPVTGFFDGPIIDLLEELAVNISFYLGAIDEQANRKSAEEDLRQEQFFSKSVLDSLPGIFYLYTYPECRLVLWNKQHEVLLGYETGEMKGRHVTDWHAPGSKEAVMGAIETVMEKGQSSMDAFLLKKDGRPVPFFLTGVRFEAHDRSYFMGIGIDITDRIRADAALEESKRQLDAMAANIPGVVYRFRVNPDGTYGFNYISERSRQVLGLENNPATFFDQFTCGVAGPENRERFLKSVQHAISTKTPWEFESWYVKPSGKKIWFSAVSSPLMENDLLIFDGVIFDITDRKHAEEELLRKNKELNASYEQISANEEELRNNLDELARQEQSMRESETNLRAILDATPFPVALVDLQDDNINYWSRSALTLFGHTAPTAAEWYQLAYPDPEYQRDVIDRWKPYLEHAKLSGQPVNTGEYRVTCRDGSVRICELYATFLADKLIVTFNDITESKRAEEALSAVLNGITESALMITQDGTVLAANETVALRLGLERADELVGQNIWGLLPAEVQKSRRSEVQEVVQSGQPVEFEDLRNDRVIHQTIYPVKDPDGTIRRLAVFGVDVTGQKLTENALAESEKQYRTYIDNSPDGVFIVDAAGNYQDVNPSGCSMLGYSREELLTLSINDLIPANSLTTRLSAFMKLQETGSMMTESVLVKKNGDYLPVILNAVRLPDERYLAFCTDITDIKQAGEALRVSEEKYRNIFSAENDTVLFVDTETGSILETNKAACHMFGYSPEEFARLKITDLSIEPEKTRTAIDTFQKWIPLRYVKKKDGTIFPVEISISWFVLNDRDVHIAAIRDITERLKTQKELEGQKRFLEKLFETTSNPIFYKDSNGVYLGCNAAFERYIGVPRDQIVGNTVYAFAPRELADVYKSKDHELFDTPGIQQYESLVQYADGSLRSVIFSKATFSDDQGNVEGLVGVMLDVTERKQAEEALRESEARFDQLARQSKTVIWEVDARGLYTYVSHMSADVWGYQPDELVGRIHYYDLHPEQGREEFEQATLAVFDRKEPFRDLENAIRKRDGRVIWVSTNGIPIINADGSLQGYKGSDTEITERKRAETALNQANRKLTLLSNITRHDINNQLTVLKGYISIMKKKQQDPALENYFEKAGTSVERISAMIRFTKEYEEIGVYTPAWQDCRTIVDLALKEATLGKITIINDFPADAEVFADPLIIKVFFNLIDNAVRHGGEITTIRFSAEECNGVFILLCEDDGNGVPQDAKEKIFIRGYGKNTGLGLSLSKEILSITGITITETGKPGKGARFEMTVPKGMYR